MSSCVAFCADPPERSHGVVVQQIPARHTGANIINTAQPEYLLMPSPNNLLGFNALVLIEFGADLLDGWQPGTWGPDRRFGSPASLEFQWIKIRCFVEVIDVFDSFEPQGYFKRCWQ